MVARFQSVISKEIKSQLLEKEGKENPDYVIACVGGGSNAAGAYYHFLDEKDVTIIAVEAAGLGVHSGESAATSALGKVGVIHGSKTLLMQTPDGQITEPYSISAGLDYPGVGPMHANLYATGRAQFISITDEQAMHWGLELSKLESDQQVKTLLARIDSMKRGHANELTVLRNESSSLESSLKKTLEDELASCRQDELQRTASIVNQLKNEQSRRQQLQTKLQEVLKRLQKIELSFSQLPFQTIEQEWKVESIEQVVLLLLTL
jgi:hypothetical protein